MKARRTAGNEKKCWNCWRCNCCLFKAFDFKSHNWASSSCQVCCFVVLMETHLLCEFSCVVWLLMFSDFAASFCSVCFLKLWCVTLFRPLYCCSQVAKDHIKRYVWHVFIRGSSFKLHHCCQLTAVFIDLACRRSSSLFPLPSWQAQQGPIPVVVHHTYL